MINPHEAEEEVEKLKAWWKQYGRSVVAGVLLGLALLIAYRYWDAHVEAQREAASALYEQLLEAMRRGETKVTVETGKKLIEDYDGTPYAGMAALLLARVHLEAGEEDRAREMLRWVVEHGRDPASRHAARLRLARLLLDDNETEAMLKLLAVADRRGFESEYQELLGDAYVRLGRLGEARAAYTAALEHLPQGSRYGVVLRMKRDDLGEGKS